MKKTLLIIALLLTGLFYAVSTNYEMIGVNNSDGFVFDNNQIQTNVFADTVNADVKSKQVFASEGIYKRLSTVYYGDKTKVKINDSYPMYINNGEAIKLLSGRESMITDNFDFIDTYSNLILNDGLAFNTDFERSDFNEYILVHLTNNLYVNTKEMHVYTFLNSYTIPANSIIYMSVDRISYYSLKGDNTFVGNTIYDIDESTYIQIGDVEISYAQLLLNLGETVEYHQIEQRGKVEEDDDNQQQIGDKKHGKVTLNNTNREKRKKSSETRKRDRSDDNNDDDDGKIIDEPDDDPGEDDPVEPEPPKEWMPTVEIGGKFKPGVYSLTTSVIVDDPYNVIYGGLVYEIFDQNAKTKNDAISKIYQNGKFIDGNEFSNGKEIRVIGSTTIEGIVYYQIESSVGENEYLSSEDVRLQILKRATYVASTTEETDFIITGLKPENNYLVSAYYKVKDPNGRPYNYVDEYGVTHTQFDFFTPKAFTTKPVSELGSIIFTEFDTSELFGSQISINNIGFTTNSDMDAISTLSRVQYKITKDGELVDANILPSKQLATLIKMQPTAFSYRNNIESNSTYEVEFTCFDMYGNELVVKNNKTTVKTCKLAPTSKITIEYNKDSQGKEILGEINISAEFENPDSVPYKNLRYVIFDENGQIFKFYDEESGTYLDYVPCIPGENYHLDGFTLGHSYTASLVCECDTNDGNGFVTREITSRDFTTSPLSLLGSLYLNVNNVSKDKCPDERHRRAVLDVSLANATNEQLPQYVDFLSVTLTSDSGVTSYTFTEEELNTLFVDKGKVTIDTDNLTPPGLVGISKYSISFTSQHEFEDGTLFTIPVNPSLKQLTTVRTPVEVLMTTPVTAPGYINTSVMINDKDGVIVGDTAVLKIYEILDNNLKLTASFLINKNTKEYKDIILSSDSSVSTDGVTYDIKQDGKYRFIFQAEEANTETGAASGYVLLQKDIQISIGVKGKIYLSSLEEFDYGKKSDLIPNEYEQVSYIESSGSEYINTGISAIGKISCDSTFAFMANPTSSWTALAGSRNASGQRCYLFALYNNNYYWTNGYNGTFTSFVNAKPENGKIYKASTSLENGKQTLSFDGNVYTQKTTGNLNINNQIYIFGINYNGTFNYTNKSRIYNFKLYVNDELKRDYVPCYKVSNHEYGLYDLVEGRFYGNASGKGAFTGGGVPIDPTYSDKDSASSYLSNVSVNLSYPEGWLGNKNFFVNVQDDSNPNVIDKLVFKYNASNSTENVYNYDIISSLNNALADKNISLTYDDRTNEFKGKFKYIVNKHADKEKKYTFDLYTTLLDNIYLNNLNVEFIDGTKQEVSNISFKQDINLDIELPVSGLSDYSFYIDMFNEEKSLDIIYDTLVFKHDTSKVEDNKLTFDVYMASDMNNKLQTVILDKKNISGESIYSGTINGVIFEKIEDDSYSYRFEAYRKIENDSLTVPLDSTSFSTEAIIYTISNINEFFAVKTNNRKYVVINDLYYEDLKMRAYNQGKWGSTNFNAQIDFQGFTLNYVGSNNLIYNMTKTAEISNMVFNTTANLAKYESFQTAGYNRGAGALTWNNYGKLTNISIIYHEVQPEDIADEGSKLVKNSYYWSDDPDYATTTGKKYTYLNNQTGLAVNNYGIIENFTADVQSTINTALTSGVISCYNYGTIRNGYVYSSNSADYKAEANVYRNSSYSSYEGVSDFGYICGQCLPKGIYVGVVENVYAIGNVTNRTNGSTVKYENIGTTNCKSLGIVCGYDSSIVRNAFSNGNVVKINSVQYTNKDGTTRTEKGVKTVNDVLYGPTVGYVLSSTNRNPNINYMSTYSYNNKVNYPTSTIALRSKSWVNGVLNADRYNEFIVDEMISVACYPQVKMDDIMPAQQYLELPPLPSKDEVDILFSEVYEFGQKGNEDIDTILNERRSGNELGDLLYEEKEGSPYRSNSQIVMAYVSDKSASQIHDFVLSDEAMQCNLLLQTMDGTGVTVCYLEVYNPTQALTRYHVNGIYFKNYAGERATPMYSVSRDLEVSYTKLITKVSEWRSVIEHPNQNHRLGADLDFTGISMEDIFVNANFSGTLDGMDENGVAHTIRNIEYDSKAFSSIFPSTLDGSATASTGIFKSISGKVRNLTLENINIEGSENVGILAGTMSGAEIDNVFIKNSYVAGTNRIGGFASSITYTDIMDSGISNTKLIGVNGKSGTNDTNYIYGIGGIASRIVTENNLERIYANNIYIESFDTQTEYPANGGLIANIQGEGNKIIGCYATGTINSNAYTSGGLIGSNYNEFEMNYCYADVDINSYYYNAGGLVGLVRANITSASPLMSFGDIHSAIILKNDDRKNTFDLIGNIKNLYSGTTYKLNGIYYDKATLLNNGIKTQTGTSFNSEYINSDEVLNNLGGYFVREIDFNNSGELKGILPKLVDLNGNILGNQPDNFISGFDSGIKVDIDDSIHGKVIVDIKHNDNITIENIYTDYSYVNSLINKDNINKFYGVKSLTNRKALTYQLDEDYTSTGTRFTLSSISENCYYDYYYVTAIEYSINGETYYLRLNHRLDNIEQSFKSITNSIDYERYVTPSIAENFIIEGDIDLSNRAANYYDEEYTNIVINRLIGSKGDESNYLDLKDNKEAKPYFKISNLNINGILDTNAEHGYVYGCESNLFRVVLSDLSNIVFENIKISGSYESGLIGLVQGDLHNISFIDCDIDNKNYTRYAALCRVNKGSVVNIYIDSCDIKSNSTGTGVLIGNIFTNDYGEDVKNVYIENISLSNSSTYSGSLFARAQSDYPYYKGQLDVKNITLVNGKINATGNYVGGIIGYGCDYRITNTYEDLNVYNTTINSNGAYVGGIMGDNAANGNATIRNCYVYKSYIKSVNSTGYVGGIIGIYPGNLHNATVEDCTIIGTGYYTGGITGSYTYTSPMTVKMSINSYEDEQDQDLFAYVLNSKIYGNLRVGGIAGNTSATIYNSVVQNCEIKGNQQVGGIVGYTNESSGHAYCTVTNTTITPWKNSAEAIYGPAYSSAQQEFGGISGAVCRVLSCIVENSFIGGENANYVGGLTGISRGASNSTTVVNSSVENSIVVGKNWVGGLFGVIQGSTSSKYMNYDNIYSNAYVYGNDYVGGISGALIGVQNVDPDTKEILSYSPMPIIENVYFTGSLTGNNKVSGLYGYIVGNSEEFNNFFRHVSSFPSFIKGHIISPLFNDSTNTFAYKLSNLLEDESDVAIALRGDTVLYLIDEEGNSKSSMMSVMLSNTKDFAEYLGNDFDLEQGFLKYISTYNDVKDNFDAGIAGDSFITTYSNVDEYKNNFYNFSTLDTIANTKTSYGTKAYADMSSIDYMPMNYTHLKDDYSVNDLIFYRNIDNNLIGNRYHTSKNPFVGEADAYKSINVQQGVGIPGSAKDLADNSYMSNIHDLYATGGLYTTGLGTIVSYDEDGNNSIYVPKARKDIPNEYKQVEYLKFTGTQYIDTGYKPNQNTKVEGSFLMTQKNYSSFFYGGTTVWAGASFGFYMGAGGTRYSNYNSDVSVGFDIPINTIFTIVRDKNLLYYNNQLKYTHPASTFQSTRNMEIGRAGYSNSYVLRGNAYYLKIWENNVLVRDFVPVIRVSDSVYGMYDVVEGKFYNSANGKFTGSETIEKTDFERAVYLYPSSSSTISLEMDDSFLALLKKLDVKANLIIDNNKITEISSSDKIITLKHDYKSGKVLQVAVEKDDTNFKLTLSDINSAIKNNISACGDHIFYISDGKLYSEIELIDDSKEYIHLYHDEVITSDGSIYSIPGLNYIGKVASVFDVVDSKPIYSLIFNNKHIDTYGTYSVIDGNISDDYKLFSVSGNLIALSSSKKSVADPLYAKYSDGNSSILMLSKDGKVYSIGTYNILDKLTSAGGFSNGSIVSISTNLHSNVNASNNYVGFTYANGEVAIYDVRNGNRITAPLSVAKSSDSKDTSLSSFLKSSLSLGNVFSFSSNSQELSGEKNKTEQISNLLTTTGLSLNDVVNYASEDSDNMNLVVNAVKNNKPSLLSISTNNLNVSESSIKDSEENGKEQTIVIDTPIIDNTHSEDNSGPVSSIQINGGSNISISIANSNGDEIISSESNNSDELEIISEIPSPGDPIIDEESIENIDETFISTNGLITDKSESLEKQFITVYNGETNEFDILDVEELLENPQEVEPENTRVVDRSTLKALYNALGETKDNTTKRGIVIYSIIAVIIVLLLIPVIILKHNLKKKH